MDTHELVRIVNDFLVSSSELLNSFCARFEQRILALDARMDSFERQLLLMERKLADVPSAQQQIVDIVQHEESIQILELGPSSQMPIEKQPEEARPKSPDGTKKEQQAGGASGGGVPAREHPLFGKYFRMLKMASSERECMEYFVCAQGVPEPAVRQKMRAENVDPAILELVTELIQYCF